MAKSDDELNLAKQRINDLSAINSTLQDQITGLQNRDKVSRRTLSLEMALGYAGSVPQAVPDKDKLIAVATDIHTYLSQ